MRRQARIWGAIAILFAIAAMLVAGWLGATSEPRASSTASEVLFAAHVMAGAMLIAASAVLAVTGIRPAQVIALSASALALQAEILRNAPLTPPVARTVLTAIGLAAPVAVVVLTLPPRNSAPASGAAEQEALWVGWLRRASIGVAVAIGVLAAAIALVRVPLYDLACRYDCGLDSWIAVPSPATSAALSGWYLAALAASSALAGALLWARARTGAPAADAWFGPAVLGAATATLLAETIRGVAVLARSDALLAWDLVRLLAYVALGATALVAGAALARRLRAVRELTRRIGHEAEPGGLRARLAAILDDPSLSLGFWIPEAGRFVDEQGAFADAPHGATRIRLSRRGRPLAMIATSRRADEAAVAVRSIGESASLAIDNERWFAEMAHRSHQLEATRRAIVDRSSTERHAIERGLHDGVQAGLVAALFELARLRADKGPSPEADRLERALTRAHGRARELAHGVYPALLDGVGLSEALRELASTRPLSVTVAGERAPMPVEHALYRLVRAASDGGAPLTVDVSIGGDARVVLSGARESPPAAILDEIGVLGGRVDRHGDTVTAVVPCAP
ncbi:histidine kinase [Microbacterium sp. BK668]|uniref:histidine kinase n=1 Tax=Microbacterium sp. BK668 TaxID=2512118 RepID=UPI001060EAD5|nr:histidine kinase [Microbacterium sp. BK668]TDN90743.1 histidine kinase [Microbacterium sp. BK668]